MRYIINERQYRLLTEEENILRIPFSAFDNNWEVLQKFLEKRGNPPYEITDDLDLRGTNIESLGNLISVGGDLNLEGSKLKTLGNLTSVGGNLYLAGSKIQSFGNLTSVGGDLYLYGKKTEPIRVTSAEDYLDLFRRDLESFRNVNSTEDYLELMSSPLSKRYTEKEIRSMVEVGGKVYL